jgi:hypothetical protein
MNSCFSKKCDYIHYVVNYMRQLLWKYLLFGFVHIKTKLKNLKYVIIHQQ